tara:strand:+ start:385 stop:567 length:183 start_codon:yes stop_codon:yes gene_type:complete
MNNEKFIDGQSFIYWDDENQCYVSGVQFSGFKNEDMAMNVSNIILDQINDTIMRHSKRKN